MNHLRKFNEAMFDTSTLEDILCEFTDEGLGWNIVISKNSKGKSFLNLYITFGCNPNWKAIEPSILRVDKYLIIEGYFPKTNTIDIIDDIENECFDPENWIPNYSTNFGERQELDLQLSYGTK